MKPKVTPEKKFRKHILTMAKHYNCEVEIRQIMERYDNLLKNCTNELEYKQIGIMGIAEIHKYLHMRGALIVNGELILPADPDYKEPTE